MGSSDNFKQHAMICVLHNS